MERLQCRQTFSGTGCCKQSLVCAIANRDSYVCQHSLLGPDPNEKLARHLDAARPFELTQPSLNFQPSLFTLSFSQLFDWLAKKGAFLHALEKLCAG